MAQWNRDTPWRQGHLLGHDAIEALGLRNAVAPAQTLVIVASHDCDLAQAPEGEPVVEVVIGRVVTDKDGNCTHAKNARKLHVEFAGDSVFWAEFEATAKLCIEKRTLISLCRALTLACHQKTKPAFRCGWPVAIAVRRSPTSSSAA